MLLFLYTLFCLFLKVVQWDVKTDIVFLFWDSLLQLYWEISMFYFSCRKSFIFILFHIDKLIFFSLQIIQIWMNYSNGHTGQLSRTATLALNFRSFGRLYTSLKESKDIIGVTEFGIHCFLNVILSAQVLFFNKKQKLVKKLVKKDK